MQKAACAPLYALEQAEKARREEDDHTHRHEDGDNGPDNLDGFLGATVE